VDKAALERQVAQSRGSMEQVTAELADLKAQVAAAGRTTQEQLSALNEMGATNEKLQAQVKDLNGQVAALRADNARLAAAGDSAGAIRAELADMQARLTESQKAAEQQSATVAELTGANEKLTTELKDLQGQLATLRADNSRLAQSDAARQEAEARVASLTAASSQLATAQRDLAAARAETARLNETMQALERDRTGRITLLQQENAAIAARLRQAQGTLDQIASAARLINGSGVIGGGFSGGASSAPAAPAAPRPLASSPPVVPAPRIHTVVEGDSLTRISVRYYGTGARWQDIYEANREVLRGENSLRPGQRLRIP
jgi:nucleoid-associated protein YgaU